MLNGDSISISTQLLFICAYPSVVLSLLYAPPPRSSSQPSVLYQFVSGVGRQGEGGMMTGDGNKNGRVARHFSDKRLGDDGIKAIAKMKRV